MKNYHLLLGFAALALAGCSSDDLINGVDNQTNESGEISFGVRSSNVTRAQSVGVDAATKLNNHFVVYATKHSSAEDGTIANDALVYNQYNVEYAAGTAGTTASNVANWEYVGKKAYSSEVTTDQSIKYWDYAAANGYTFYAFSSKDITYPADATNDLVSVTKTTEGSKVYDKGYSVTVKKGASLNDLYFSDRKPVAKTDYGNTVTFTFRSMTAKVRVGFYETIPGYSVKIDKFYYDNDATAPVVTYKAMDKADEANFEAALQNVDTEASSNTFTVAYYDDTNTAIENHTTITNSTADYNYTLKLGEGIQKATALGTTSTGCTWDNEGNYTTVLPFEANSNPMFIRCDYTLTSTDGSGETIKVKNARVVVPVQYVQWKSNYAYTYLFKISDKTNGTTGVVPSDPDQPTDPNDPTNPQDPNNPTPVDPTDPDSPTYGDPEGLYPITFDAYVEATTDADMDEQQTISSVATNSIATYENGKVITAKNEYKAGDIYVVDTKTADGSVIAPTAIAAVTEAKTTEAAVVTVTTTGDAISEATVLANLNGSPNGITLADATASLVQKVPAADGSNYDFGANGAVKFTATANTTYAYVYCTTKYVAPTYEAAGDTYDAATTYYLKTDKGVYYAASGLTADNYDANKANLYTLKTAGTPGVYDVKVIKVAE